MADALRIDPEFADLCPPLTPEERNLLEASIDADGCRESIVTWANHEDTILDGHNRYDICTSLGKTYKTKALKLDTREDAIEWIIANQLGRRNLSDEQKAYLRGKRRQAEVKSVGRPDKCGNDCHISSGSTDERLAEEYSVSPKTIRNDAKFSAAVDTLAKNAGKEVKGEILSGRSGLSKKDVVAIASEPPAKQAAAVKAAKASSKSSPSNGSAVKTDVERLIEGIEGLIEKVNAMAARRMGHNNHSRIVVATLKEAISQSKAMAKSWRNQ